MPLWLCQIPNARSVPIRGAVHRLLIHSSVPTSRRIADASEDLTIRFCDLRYFSTQDLDIRLHIQSIQSCEVQSGDRPHEISGRTQPTKIQKHTASGCLSESPHCWTRSTNTSRKTHDRCKGVSFCHPFVCLALFRSTPLHNHEYPEGLAPSHSFPLIYSVNAPCFMRPSLLAARFDRSSLCIEADGIRLRLYESKYFCKTLLEVLYYALAHIIAVVASGY